MITSLLRLKLVDCMNMSMLEHGLDDLYILINMIYCCKSSHSVDKIWFENKNRRKKNKCWWFFCIYIYLCILRIVRNEGVDDDENINVHNNIKKREIKNDWL